MGTRNRVADHGQGQRGQSHGRRVEAFNAISRAVVSHRLAKPPFWGQQGQCQGQRKATKGQLGRQEIGLGTKEDQGGQQTRDPIIRSVPLSTCLARPPGPIQAGLAWGTKVWIIVGLR